MTVRILEYDAYPPRGVDITRNGYVDFETRREFLRTGIGASQVVPANESESGTGFLVDGVLYVDEKEVRTVKKLPHRYMYDLHRRIADYLKREDFKEAVLEFANLYGCWFSAGVTGRDYKLHNVDEWRAEWELVARVTNVHVNKSLTRIEIEPNLNRFTNVAIESQLWRKDKNSREKFVTAIRPMSIGGWVWALIAKDYYDEITYTPCPNPKCTREIPSISPTSGKGNLKYCSESCRNAVNYKRRSNETT